MTSIRFDFQLLRTVKGKLLGSAAGFAVGGPLGALIGAVAGHAIDNLARDTDEEEIAQRLSEGVLAGTTAQSGVAGSQAAAFIIGLVVLGAKMARADERMEAADIEGLMTAFRLPEDQAKSISRLYAKARNDAGEVEPYAEQLSRLFQGRQEILEELLDGLFRYALLDHGAIHPNELAYLRRISFIFGFSANDFAQRAARHGIDIKGPGSAGSSGGAGSASILKIGDPFRILGLTSRASNSEIKQAWRRLIQEYHPDRLIARNLQGAALAEANDRMASINAAYDEICRSRGLS